MALQDILDRLGSDPIIRNWDTYANYDPAGVHKNVLFLAIDSHKIYFNGDEYGGVDGKVTEYVQSAQATVSNLDCSQDDWVTVAETGTAKFFSGLLNLRQGWFSGEPNGVTLALNLGVHDTDIPSDKITAVVLNAPLNNIDGTTLPLSFKAIRIIKDNDTLNRLLQVRINKAVVGSLSVTKVGVGLTCITPFKQNEPLENQTVVAEVPITLANNATLPVLDLSDTLIDICKGDRGYFMYPHYLITKGDIPWPKGFNITKSDESYIDDLLLKFDSGNTSSYGFQTVKGMGVIEIPLHRLNTYTYSSSNTIQSIFSGSIPLDDSMGQDWNILLYLNHTNQTCIIKIYSNVLNLYAFGYYPSNIGVTSNENWRTSILKTGIISIPNEDSKSNFIKNILGPISNTASVQVVSSNIYFGGSGELHNHHIGGRYGRVRVDFPFKSMSSFSYEYNLITYPQYRLTIEDNAEEDIITNIETKEVPFDIPVTFELISLGEWVGTEAEYQALTTTPPCIRFNILESE